MEDVALLVLRGVAGGLLAGHGAQKLFGWFEGPGLRGTKGWLESMGLRPGHPWALAAGLSEFGGGVLTLLGLGGPVGPLGIVAAMTTATTKVHWGKPIWVTAGGAELPVTNLAIVAALLLDGPGKYSLDEALGLDVPRWLALPGLAAVGIGVALAMLTQSDEGQSASDERGENALQSNTPDNEGDGNASQNQAPANGSAATSVPQSAPNA